MEAPPGEARVVRRPEPHEGEGDVHLGRHATGEHHRYVREHAGYRNSWLGGSRSNQNSLGAVVEILSLGKIAYRSYRLVICHISFAARDINNLVVGLGCVGGSDKLVES